MVEGSGLENRRGVRVTVGSNPTPSARSNLDVSRSPPVAAGAAQSISLAPRHARRVREDGGAREQRTIQRGCVVFCAGPGVFPA